MEGVIGQKMYTSCRSQKRQGDSSKMIRAIIAFALGCTPGLDGETLLLKTPHTLVTGHEDIKLVLTRKHLPC